MLSLAEMRTGYQHLPRMHRQRLASSTVPGAIFKQQVEDFRVDEILPETFTAANRGEHFWVRVEKRNLNTNNVIDLLARSSGCRARDIGCSGQKDRRAVTTQWFSLPIASMTEGEVAINPETALPARLHAEPVFAAGCELLDQFRHSRKLKTGTHSGNRFRLILRQCDSGGREQFESRLWSIQQHGFPNYFGLQRFGIEGRNLLTYQKMSADSCVTPDNGRTAVTKNRGAVKKSRRKRQSPQAQRARSMALSAARSVMFNAVLACRVNADSCMKVQNGEPLLLANSSSFFVCDLADEGLPRRLANFDVQTSGPLWGVTKQQDQALIDWQQRETVQWLDWSACCLPEETRVGPELLLQSGLQHQRRSLLARPAQLSWKWQASDILALEFTLPAGVFATALLRELGDIGQ